VNDALEAVNGWLRGRAAEDRDLTPDELSALAEELAGRPELWEGLVRHSPDERVYVRLRRDHHLEVWLICWMPSQDTGLHDHDLSAGAVQVIAGRLAEDRMRLGRAELDTTEYAAGQGFRFDASRIHNVRHAGDGPATSLHLYSPPLWRMGYYAYGEDGRLARRAATYVEELGPAV
jgi:predicted metal-dependent enzyme (double-stranded beta helix superfamily)